MQKHVFAVLFGSGWQVCSEVCWGSGSLWRVVLITDLGPIVRVRTTLSTFTLLTLSEG